MSKQEASYLNQVFIALKILKAWYDMYPMHNRPTLREPFRNRQLMFKSVGLIKHDRFLNNQERQ